MQIPEGHKAVGRLETEGHGKWYITIPHTDTLSEEDWTRMERQWEDCIIIRFGEVPRFSLTTWDHGTGDFFRFESNE